MINCQALAGSQRRRRGTQLVQLRAIRERNVPASLPSISTVVGRDDEQPYLGAEFAELEAAGTVGTERVQLFSSSFIT